MRDKNYQSLLGSRVWKDLRARYLGAHPLCEICEAQGLTALATEVHHKIPIGSETSYAGMRRLAYDVNNLQALCHDCHERIHEGLDSHNHKKIIDRKKAQAETFAQRWLKPLDPVRGE